MRRALKRREERTQADEGPCREERRQALVRGRRAPVLREDRGLGAGQIVSGGLRVASGRDRARTAHIPSTAWSRLKEPSTARSHASV